MNNVSKRGVLATMTKLGYPLDRPDRDLIDAIHTIDNDPITTKAAVAISDSAKIIADSKGVGVNDPDFAREVLEGLAHSSAAQQLMKGQVEAAQPHEAAASAHAGNAVKAARAARQLAEQRLQVPTNAVVLPGLGTATRAQVRRLHGELKQVAAYRESAGNFEHRDTAPRAAVRYGVEAAISLGEALLVTKRLANASWYDMKSLILFLVLSALFSVATHFLTDVVGRTLRDYREMNSASEELTAIGISDEDGAK
jgi:hypothetical protein